MKFVLAFCLLFFFGELIGQPTAIPYSLPGIRMLDSIKCTPVKDQAQSPTCWAFATNSLFESDLIRKGGAELNLSEMFIARYAYIDKAKAFLASKGKTYYEGGGQFHDVIRVVRKYGIVPEEVYNGRPHGETNHDHSRLDTAMKIFVKRLLDRGKTSMTSLELAQINDTLDRYLGKVPAIFWYHKKKYTPRSFADEVAKVRDDYAEMVSFTDHPLYQKFVLRDKFNWANDSFFNISLEDMQMMVDTALARGWSVEWEGDVTDTGFNPFAGTATLSNSDHAWDEERINNYKNETTERDHMLHIVGMGKDSNNTKWYFMKNSWGGWYNKFGGYLYMDENYFKLKTVILFVNREGLPQSLTKKLSPMGRVL